MQALLSPQKQTRPVTALPGPPAFDRQALMQLVHAPHPLSIPLSSNAGRQVSVLMSP